jgi:TolB protein
LALIIVGLPAHAQTPPPVEAFGRLPSIADAAISPDGKLVAYSAGTLGRMRIVVQPARGGPARPITDSATVPPTPGLAGDHRWPRWSPDGLTIAFEAGRGIRAVSVLGGPTRVLVDTGMKPSWSPDGRHLVYTLRQGLWIMRLDSATSRSIDVGTTVSGGSAVWSPDGRRLAFVRGGSSLYVGGSTARSFGEKAQSSVWIVDADGRNPVAITSEDHLNASPAWGADGGSIFFVSDRDGLCDVYRQRIDRDGRPRGAPQRLTTGANVHTFTLSRDGSQIAYSTAEKQANIWMAPVSAGETPFTAARQLTRDRETIEYLALSRDGRWLSYDSDRDGAFRHIYKRSFDIDAGVGEPVRVTADSADDFAPRWSPDGREIAFHRIVRGTRDIVVVTADGRKTDRVTNDPAQDYDPDWAPDGRSIVYRARLDSVAGATQEIFVTTRDETGRWSSPQPVAVRGRGGIGQTVRWSPSGESLAGGAGTVPVSGGQARRFAERKHLDGIVRFIAWGPSPRELYFMTRDSVNAASYWRAVLPRAGAGPAAPQRLLRLSDPTKRANTNAFDTDGRNLFFTIAADRAAVFVARIESR